MPAGERRPAQHAELRRAWRPRPCTRSPAAGRSSPASAPTPSTSTSAASSTSGRCGRSTPAPDLDARHHGGQRGAGVQRAHPRAPGAEAGPGQGRQRCRPRSAPASPSSACGPRRAGGSPRSSTPARASTSATGPWKQVSRLGNPLFNEVLVPMAEKDLWNARPPRRDARFAKYVDHPELAELLPVLYPGVFPNLAAYGKPRADLERDPAHRHPVPASSPGSRTSPARCRRTCSG